MQASQKPKLLKQVRRICLLQDMICGRDMSFWATKAWLYTHVLNKGGKGVMSPIDDLL